MFNKTNLKKILFFDIESVGVYNTYKDIKNNNNRLADLFKKRCEKYLFEKEKETDVDKLWESNAGLHPEFGKIVCISSGYFDPETLEIQIKSYTGEEIEILKTFKKLLNKIDNLGFYISGHTIKEFDVPYIAKRMLINGISPPNILQVHDKKPWETKFIDLRDIWSFGSFGQRYTPLDLISCSLDIESPKDSMDGSKVHSEFWNNDNLKGIKKYCEKDVIATMEIFNKLSSYDL